MKRVFVFVMIVVIVFPIINAITEEECSQTYFFILSNNYNYTVIDLINSNVSQQEIDNYPLECFDYNKLPIKPLELLESEEEDCSIEVEDSFEYFAPFFIEFDIGTPSCESLKNINYIFRIEERGGYLIKGLEIFPIFVLIVALILIYVLRSSSEVNRKLREI